MRIYRAGYKDRSGKQRKSAKWYLDFADHNRLRHKIPAFTDKRLSEAFGRNIEALVNCRIAGLEPDAKLNQCELKDVRYIFPVLSFFCITMIIQFYTPFTHRSFSLGNRG